MARLLFARDMEMNALQDENHRLRSIGDQWVLEHRKPGAKGWKITAYLVTREGIEFLLARRHSVQASLGYMPLHHWPVPPVLPEVHPIGKPR